jgi:predicted permease
VLYNIELDLIIKKIIFVELMMPLAVANVNLASLYECKPKVVTALVMVTSVLFLGIVFGGVKILDYL